MTRANDAMIALFETAALEAGRAIMEVYADGPHVTIKVDHSPVTEADEKAEAIILAHLARGFPEIPVVAEESVAAGRVPDVSGGAFFLVDPLDGTKEYIARNGDFTVNIALIENGSPVAGIVYAPARGLAYTGWDGCAVKLAIDANFAVASRQAVRALPCGSQPVALISRSHNSPATLAYLDELGITKREVVGSSLKFGMIAEGCGDLYPRFSRTMEWDTAAGDAVLRAAGGDVTDTAGASLTYGKPGFENPFFVASGPRSASPETA